MQNPKIQRENHTNLLLLQVLWKRKYQVNKSRCQTPYSRFNSVLTCLSKHRHGTTLFKASAHSFKQFTSRLLKSTFSLCTYITRMDVMLDFICIGPVDLPGARRKRQNTKWKISCSQWDSNPQPFDSKSDALPTELAGLGECYPFKWAYYIHVLPILMYTLL